MNENKITIASDNQQVLSKLQITLQEKGYEINSFTDGLQALNNIRKEHPQVLVLSDSLSKVGGLMLCRLLKFDRRYEDLIIILLISRANTADKEIANDLGADAFFVEPYELDKLSEKIVSLMN